MKLPHGLHLTYCTNVHPGEDWPQTLASLNQWTLRVKEELGNPEPFGLGLRLSDLASRQLSEPGVLLAFQRWLEQHCCYVFTFNGFPFGPFHGAPVKEAVYRPDWTTPDRLAYTQRLFDLLAQLAPVDIEGSISTLPGSFKEFIQRPEQERAIRANLWRCVEYVNRLSDRTGRQLCLGLEPEPLCLMENSLETARWFDRLRNEHPGDDRLPRHLGVTYDTCHFAVEFEEPGEVLGRFQQHGIRICKLQLSNALKLRPTPEALRQLATFQDPVYLHQTLVRDESNRLTRFKDLELALADARSSDSPATAEWRSHFHIPLHARPPGELDSTADHILALLPLLAAQPQLCSHLEMETYTWSVLPEALRAREVSAQLVGEYRWLLQNLAACGLGAPP